MILPPPQDLAAFVRGEEVIVRVRIDAPGVPQEAFLELRFCEQAPDGTWAFYSNHPSFYPKSYRESGGGLTNPLGPPGTRHGVPVPELDYMSVEGVHVTGNKIYHATVTTPEPPVREADGWYWSALVRKETR